MSWKDVLFGAVDAALPQSSVSVMEACCKKCDWTPDERIGEDGIIIKLRNPQGKVIAVLISGSTSGPLASFVAMSFGSLAPRDVRPEIPLFLLNRKPAFGGWRLVEKRGGKVGFSLSYTAHMPGMDHRYFQKICETMADEVGAFDDQLRAAGLL